MIKDPNCKSKNWRVDTVNEAVINEILKLQYDKNYIKEMNKALAETLKENLSKFEAKRLAMLAENEASFAGSEMWQNFWNNIDDAFEQTQSGGDRGFWANASSVGKGALYTIPKLLLRDFSSLCVRQQIA